MNEVEIAITGATAVAINSAAKSAKGLLTSLLGPVADIYGQMIASSAQLRLLENQIRNFKKVKEIVDENEIDIKQVDLKVLFPYLNGIALEEDEKLQDMWANLFVNYIDSTKTLSVTVYPKILSELSSQDAEIALHMSKQPDGRIIIEARDDAESLITTFKVLQSLPNLVRIGIVEQTLPTDGRLIITANREITDSEPRLGYFQLTNFGWEFLGACTR